ncbi:MAG: SDR family NAD(P)-dependent oxidoreductase [Hymenobacter sp.]
MSMQGKVCLVTGATGGMGEVTARALAQQGATTVLVGRDAEKGRAAVACIRQATGNPRVELLLADLSVQADIHRLAAAFRAGYLRLDVLVNNAGAVFGQRQLTADGIERTFALNHLSYFLLTHLLLDRLTASAPARVVNVASATHQMVKPADVGDWQSTRSYSMTQAYHRSKLANLLFTFELARRLAGTGVTVNAAAGPTKSGLGQHSGSPLSLVLRLASALLGQRTERARRRPFTWPRPPSWPA